MNIYYNGFTYKTIFENLELKTENKELNKIILNNKIQKKLLLIYFTNIKTVNLNLLLKELKK